MTGDELYNYLLEESGYEEGDHNIWYLGCNEKFGEIDCGSFYYKWGFGESSFDIVESFVTKMYRDKIFTKKQFNILREKIEDGRKIDCMYDIGDYLEAKKNGKKWKRPKDSENFREHMKELVGKVGKFFNKKGYKVKFTNSD
jgi:hypothetical protein